MPIQLQSKKKGVKQRSGRAKENGTSPKSVPAPENLTLELRKRLQLSQSAFAHVLALSIRSLATLESGSAPTDAVARRLNEIRRLTDALEEVITRDALGKWLQTPNTAFGGLKPLEVIDRGETDRIWAMIYFLRSGVPA